MHQERFRLEIKKNTFFTGRVVKLGYRLTRAVVVSQFLEVFKNTMCKWQSRMWFNGGGAGLESEFDDLTDHPNLTIL